MLDSFHRKVLTADNFTEEMRHLAEKRVADATKKNQRSIVREAKRAEKKLLMWHGKRHCRHMKERLSSGNLSVRGRGHREHWLRTFQNGLPAH